MSNNEQSSEQTVGDEFEQWLDRQLTGDLATGNLETELRMAVATILNMPKIPKDYAVQPLQRFINAHIVSVLEELKDRKLYRDKLVFEVIDAAIARHKQSDEEENEHE